MGDKTFKVFKSFYPDGGYGYIFVLLNPDESDLVIHKTRVVKVGETSTFIPYNAIPGEALNDNARYMKPTSPSIAKIYEDLRGKRPHDAAILDFFWKTMKSPIIEYIGEIKSSELKKLR